MRRQFLKAFGLGGFASMLPVAAAAKAMPKGREPKFPCNDWLEMRIPGEPTTELDIIRGIYDFRRDTGKKPTDIRVSHSAIENMLERWSTQREYHGEHHIVIDRLMFFAPGVAVEVHPGSTYGEWAVQAKAKYIPPPVYTIQHYPPKARILRRRMFIKIT